MMKCSKVRAAENHSPSVKRKVCENNVNGRLLVTGHLSGMIGMIPTPTIYPRYTVLAKKDIGGKVFVAPSTATYWHHLLMLQYDCCCAYRIRPVRAAFLSCGRCMPARHRKTRPSPRGRSGRALGPWWAVRWPSKSAAAAGRSFREMPGKRRSNGRNMSLSLVRNTCVHLVRRTVYEGKAVVAFVAFLLSYWYYIVVAVLPLCCYYAVGFIVAVAVALLLSE